MHTCRFGVDIDRHTGVAICASIFAIADAEWTCSMAGVEPMAVF